MRSHLSLLLFALPNLALFLPATSPPAPLELKRFNLPYPSGATPATCPRPADHSNLFMRNGFTDVIRTHHRPNIYPPPTTIGTNFHDYPDRALTHVCQQVAGFAFPPLMTTVVKTEGILLQPGKQYVFSIAADVVVQRIVAWAWDTANPKPGGQTRVLGTAQPGKNHGTLTLPAVESAVKVYFLVIFARPHGQGEVGLFDIGSG